MLLNKEAECTLLLSTHAMLFVSVSVLFVTLFFKIDSLVTRPDNLMSLLPFVTHRFVVGSFFSTFLESSITRSSLSGFRASISATNEVSTESQ